MRTLAQAAVIVLAALLAAVGVHFLHPQAPPWRAQEEPLKDDEVTMAIIQERWQGKVLWVDARLRQEYEAGHIPGALLINEQELELQLGELFEEHFQDNTLPIVVYCGLETCQASRKVADYLRTFLQTMEVRVLKGGWEAWKAARQAP